MVLSQIKDPWIAKEKFDYVGNVKEKLLQEKWAEFIDKNADYYTWLENTDEGKNTLANIDKVPDDFREAILKSHNRSKVYAEFNSKKKHYEVILAFNPDLGVIGTTFQKPITKGHLRRLLDMATYLDAYLLNNGKEIIDEKFIESQA
jgi:hypothetical protein